MDCPLLRYTAGLSRPRDYLSALPPSHYHLQVHLCHSCCYWYQRRRPQPSCNRLFLESPNRQAPPPLDHRAQGKPHRAFGKGGRWPSAPREPVLDEADANTRAFDLIACVHFVQGSENTDCCAIEKELMSGTKRNMFWCEKPAERDRLYEYSAPSFATYRCHHTSLTRIGMVPT